MLPTSSATILTPLFTRATAAGAEVIQGLTDEDYGSCGFSVRDPKATSGASAPTWANEPVPL